MHEILPLPFVGNVHWWLMILNQDVSLSVQYAFEKQSFHNRTRIVGPNGQHWLSIPCHEIKDRPVSETEISYRQKWPLEHVRSLRAAYGRSPFFEHYFPELEALIQKRYPVLGDLNTALYLFLSKVVGVATPIVESAVSSKLKPIEKAMAFEKYHQVFDDRHGFVSNLSILDVLFNKGPESLDYLSNQLTILPSS